MQEIILVPDLSEFSLCLVSTAWTVIVPGFNGNGLCPE